MNRETTLAVKELNTRIDQCVVDVKWADDGKTLILTGGSGRQDEVKLPLAPPEERGHPTLARPKRN